MRLCHLNEKHIALLRGLGHKVECAVCGRRLHHGDLAYHRTATNRTKTRRSKVKFFCPGCLYPEPRTIWLQKPLNVWEAPILMVEGVE